MTKPVRKPRGRKRVEHREQQAEVPKAGTVDSILALCLFEAQKLDLCKQAFHKGLLSFAEYHDLSSSMTNNIAKFTRLARDMVGPYMHLGDIHVQLDMDPQIAIPHEDGSVDLAPLSEIELDGKQYYKFEDDDGLVRLLPINRQIEPQKEEEDGEV